ncbi:MAG: hypothetical protein K8S00_00980 [Bacteroidales bacterium]|nr:hypothetical protein [Bacteroidales bacterium]
MHVLRDAIPSFFRDDVPFNYKSNICDLEERTAIFGEEIIKFCKKIPPKEYYQSTNLAISKM